MNDREKALEAILNAIREVTNGDSERVSSRVRDFACWMSKDELGFLIALIQRAKAGEYPSQEELTRVQTTITSAYACRARGGHRFAQ